MATNQDNNTVSALVVLKALQDEAAPLFKRLSRIESIENKTDYVKAAEQTKALKELNKLAKAKQASLVDPLNAVVADIKNLFKPFTSLVDATEQDVKTKMVRYLDMQEAREKQLDEDFASGKIKSINKYAEKSAELSIQRAGARKLYRAKSTDESKTPRAYMVPDVTAITAALKAGKKVSGWELVEEKSIAI